jgi:hypothetical protein
LTASYPSPSGAWKPPSSDALRSSSRSAPPCRPTVGEGGRVLILPTPRRCSSSCMSRDSKLRPWSLCSSIGTPKRQKKSVTKASATVDASWSGMG